MFIEHPHDTNDVKKCLQVSDSTIARIKQQYKLNTVRAQRKSYNKSTVDDTTISTFIQKLIDTLNSYNHKYVMNSDQTWIQQSMPPVYTIHQAGKPAVVNMGVNTNSDISATCTSILMSCDELHKAIHEMRSEDIIQCWMNIAHQTIDELKGKSVSSSLKRSRSTPVPAQSQQNNT